MIEGNQANQTYVPGDTMALWWLGDAKKPVLIGELGLFDRNQRVSLTYAPSWLKYGFALSEDLPLRPLTFTPPERGLAVGAVDDARPDRWGERVIRMFERGSPRLSILEFLYFAGDDRYGALGVSLSSEIYAPWRSEPMPAFASVAEMSDVVRKVLANQEVPELQKRLLRPGASLGGARPKSLVSMDGDSWVVKFSEGEAADTPLIEHACMQFARRCGIDTADTRALEVPGGHAVAVKRFDRKYSADTVHAVQRLHAVSANVALRAASEDLGYPELAQLMRRLCAPDAIASQQAQLFRRMVFNILMDNTDDHEKNHAFLLMTDGRYLLSPAFDVLPAIQGIGYQQMRVGRSGTESTLDNALSECKQFGLDTANASKIIAEICTTVSGWRTAFKTAGVIDRDLDEIAQYIDGSHLRPQREKFLQ